MSAWKTRAALGAVAALLACGEAPPLPVGSLKSPTAMTVLPRPGAQRTDVLVVDSEAQGVLVLQFCNGVESGSTQPDGSPCNALDAANVPVQLASFVPAPVVYFPLVIPAPEFPTRIAANDAGELAYALSTVSQALYVLDVRENAYFTNAESEGKTVVGKVDLSDVVPDAASPVDVAVLSTLAEGQDVVLVAYAGRDGAPSYLATLVIGPAAERMVVRTTTVAPGPVRVLVRDDAVLLSSSLSRTVSVIARSGSELAPSATFIDVGGPTSVLIDAEEKGVLALRVDRFAVSQVESSSGAYAMSTKELRSPYAPQEGYEPGVVELPPVAASAGAYGRLPSLGDANTNAVVSVTRREDYGVDGKVGVAMIAHTDGRMSFLLGEPLRLATGQVTVVDATLGTTSFSSTVTVSNVRQIYGPTMSLNRCRPAIPNDCGGARDDPEPECVDLIQRAFPTSQDLRVTYKGDLAGSRAGKLSLTASGRFAMTDGFVSSYVERLVQPGDQVLMNIDVPKGSCTATTTAPLVATATVAVVDPLGLMIELDVASTSTLALRWPCGQGEVISAVQYQLYPGTDEMVLTEVSGITVIGVVQRVPVVHSSTASRASSAVLEDRLDVRVQSGGGFTCTTSISEGPPCVFTVECPFGTHCDGAVSCPGRCVPNAQEPTTAVKDYVLHWCSAVSLRVGAETASTLDIANIVRNSEPTSRIFLSAPADAVHVPLRSGFLVSYPGARLLAEGRFEVAYAEGTNAPVPLVRYNLFR